MSGVGFAAEPPIPRAVRLLEELLGQPDGLAKPMR
jgi:hypothetical protein